MIDYDLRQDKQGLWRAVMDTQTVRLPDGRYARHFVLDRGEHDILKYLDTGELAFVYKQKDDIGETYIEKARGEEE